MRCSGPCTTCSRRSSDSARCAPRRSSAEHDLEHARRKPELLEDGADFISQGAGGHRPRHRQFLGGSGDGDQQPRILGLPRGSLAVQAPEPFCLRRGPLAVGDDGSLVVTVAAFEPEDRREPFLEPRQLGWVVIDALRQLAGGRRDVGNFCLEAFDPLGEWLESRV